MDATQPTCNRSASSVSYARHSWHKPGHDRLSPSVPNPAPAQALPRGDFPPQDRVPPVPLCRPPRVSVPLQPSRDGVRAAADAIAAILPPTPLLPLAIDGIEVHLKAECLQPIGAFKIRGAYWALANLTAAERAQGVVAVSSGNHAQGIAWAARRLGIAATIVMPEDAPRVKAQATADLGARIVTYRRPGEDRDEVAARLIEAEGGTLVHAFGHPRVIEGQGSAGIEITRQLGREPSRIVACCGGGGLAAGLALACPSASVAVIEPNGWNAVGEALRQGSVVDVSSDAGPTICDALRPDATKPVNLSVLRDANVSAYTVSDDEVRAAMRFAFREARLVLEPGGAAALAAVLAGTVPPEEGLVVMATGGNVDPASYAAILTGDSAPKAQPGGLRNAAPLG